jgi:phosphoglycerate dehydrogenase-like enzyme
VERDTRPTFVILHDLTAEEKRWFAPLADRATLAFGARIESVATALARAEVLFVWGKPLDDFDAVLAAAPQLRWVHSTGAGIEYLLVPALLQRRLVLTNSRGMHSAAVAELAVGLMLAMAKNLPKLVHAQSKHRWAPEPMRGLAGAEVLIVGLGSIGSAIARAASALDMRVSGVRRNQRGSRWASQVVAFPDLHTLLPRTEYLVIACPETPETRGLIGARELDLLPRGAYLVNIARGSIVDEEAMIAALQSGRLAGAGLDVFATEPLPAESPLWDLPGVIVSPHFSIPRDWARPVVDTFVDNAERFLSGRRLRNVVNKKLGY